MRTLVLTLAGALALALAGTASAGGWATVGVAPLPNDGDATWTPTLTIKQHGKTPLEGINPSITIRNLESGATATFTATPTGTPGEYTAKVVFPSSGTWTFVVDDDFSQVHTFAPFRIGGVPAADGGSSLVWTLSGSAVLALALAALLAFPYRRRPRAQAIPA